MTTPKAKLAGLALIAVLNAGFTLGLTAPAGAGLPILPGAGRAGGGDGVITGAAPYPASSNTLRSTMTLGSPVFTCAPAGARAPAPARISAYRTAPVMRRRMFMDLSP